jgi:hypothetical protein
MCFYQVLLGSLKCQVHSRLMTWNVFSHRRCLRVLESDSWNVSLGLQPEKPFSFTAPWYVFTKKSRSHDDNAPGMGVAVLGMGSLQLILLVSEFCFLLSSSYLLSVKLYH